MGLTNKPTPYWVAALKHLIDCDEGWLGDNYYEVASLCDGMTYTLQVTFTHDRAYTPDKVYGYVDTRHHVRLYKDHLLLQEVPEEITNALGSLLARRLLKDYICRVDHFHDPVHRVWRSVFGFRLLYGSSGWKWYDLRITNTVTVQDAQRFEEAARMSGIVERDALLLVHLTRNVINALPGMLDKLFPMGYALLERMPEIDTWLNAVAMTAHGSAPPRQDEWRSTTGARWQDIQNPIRLDPSLANPKLLGGLDLLPKRKVRL